MPDPGPPGPLPTVPSPPRLEARDVLLLIAGLALVAAGAYLAIAKGFIVLSSGAAGIGLSLMPWRLTGFLGGALMLIGGGYGVAAGNWLQGGLVAILGLMAIAERLKSGRD